MNLYTKPDATRWRGRSQPAGGYWHQHVQLCKLDELPEAGEKGGWVLLGYACDAGVTRNQGRPGASEAPSLVWPHLARLSWHLPQDSTVYMVGEIGCEGDQLEASQEALSAAVSLIQQKGYRSLVMGGGHEIAYGHGTGVRNVWEPTGKRWGILNLDAHFDLRTPNPSGNSGTPFHQLLSEGSFPYGIIGIQPVANPYSLFEHAKNWGVTWLEEEACHDEAQVAKWLDVFLQEIDSLYLSLDMDVLNLSYAPGVSAPNPSGISPQQISRILSQVLASGKLHSMDIAECNPRFDQDEATLRLAARFIAQMISYA